MDHASIQSHIHDAIVVVDDRRRQHEFVVFTKNHQQLPVNSAVKGLVHQRRGEEVDWKGDIVVMKRGVRSDKLVNLVSKKDRILANFVVKRWVDTGVEDGANLINLQVYSRN